jgi:hypothetical protein
VHCGAVKRNLQSLMRKSSKTYSGSQVRNLGSSSVRGRLSLYSADLIDAGTICIMLTVDLINAGTMCIMLTVDLIDAGTTCAIFTVDLINAGTICIMLTTLALCALCLPSI